MEQDERTKFLTKCLVNSFFSLSYLCLPLALAGAWIDLRGGSPSFLLSWLLGGFGSFFLLFTWGALFATREAYGRNVSGFPFVGNVFLAAALLLGPKPWLFPLAFLLDPSLWLLAYLWWRGEF